MILRSRSGLRMSVVPPVMIAPATRIRLGRSWMAGMDRSDPLSEHHVAERRLVRRSGSSLCHPREEAVAEVLAVFEPEGVTPRMIGAVCPNGSQIRSTYSLALSAVAPGGEPGDAVRFSGWSRFAVAGERGRSGDGSYGGDGSGSQDDPAYSCPISCPFPKSCQLACITKWCYQ